MFLPSVVIYGSNVNGKLNIILSLKILKTVVSDSVFSLEEELSFSKSNLMEKTSKVQVVSCPFLLFYLQYLY